MEGETVYALKLSEAPVNDWYIENDVLLSKLHRYTQESNLKPSNITGTSSDALPLSYRGLVGAKAIKLGSWDKHPAYC